MANLPDVRPRSNENAVSRHSQGETGCAQRKTLSAVETRSRLCLGIDGLRSRRSVHYIKGPVGAVLMLEAVDEHEAEKHINLLPMVEHGLLSVEILPLTPFTGFSAFFATPTI